MNTLNGSWPDLILTAAAAIGLILLVFAVMQHEKAKKIERKASRRTTSNWYDLNGESYYNKI